MVGQTHKLEHACAPTLMKISPTVKEIQQQP